MLFYFILSYIMETLHVAYQYLCEMYVSNLFVLFGDYLITKLISFFIFAENFREIGMFFKKRKSEAYKLMKTTLNQHT